MNCAECKTRFALLPSTRDSRLRAAKDGKLFCSKKCWGVHHRKRHYRKAPKALVTLVCAGCGDGFVITEERHQKRLEQQKSGRGLFCSKKCSSNYHDPVTGSRQVPRPPPDASDTNRAHWDAFLKSWGLTEFTGGHTWLCYGELFDEGGVQTEEDWRIHHAHPTPFSLDPLMRNPLGDRIIHMTAEEMAKQNRYEDSRILPPGGINPITPRRLGPDGRPRKPHKICAHGTYKTKCRTCRAEYEWQKYHATHPDAVRRKPHTGLGTKRRVNVCTRGHSLLEAPRVGRSNRRQCQLCMSVRTCKNGHDLSDPSNYIYDNGKKRQCRICRREYMASYFARQRAQAGS